MSDAAWPKTPKALLEARYKAFESGDIDYILQSCHPHVRGKQDRKGIEAWSRGSKWLGLKVLSEKIEGEVAHVEFQIQYAHQDETVDHHEIAEFRQSDNRWFYYNSSFPDSQPFRRESPKVGRNDPCPCGSGKKYKKCCADKAA